LFRINHIKLIQFRNYLDQEFHFSSNIMAICGLNGKGKTNLLDAIYQLCFTKSYFGKADSMVATFGKFGFSITGTFTKDDQSQVISLILRESKKKRTSC